MSDDLASAVSEWRPAPVTHTDQLGAPRAAALAATLDVATSPGPGDALPPLWHWVYFGEWPQTADLGDDGHPRDGSFLPPIPNRRRMFAGGRVTMHEPLILDVPATRTADVVSATVKHGKTGELLFVTVRQQFSQDGVIRLTEEQDLVYRSDAGSRTPFARVSEPLAPQSTPWATQPVTHPALLFRFSALTANAHRIHYDERYATQIEGYPGLVVHGPLLAVYMAGLAGVHLDNPLREFRFRLQRPVFVGDEIRVQGAPGADPATAEFAVVSGAGEVHATAIATVS